MEYNEYIFKQDDSERERLVIQHECYKPSFDEVIGHLLEAYGLLGRLQQIQTACAHGATDTPKFRILEVGCGEGLLLHDVAALIEARGFLDVVEFYGFDRDATAIHTAEKFRLLSVPPRPYLNFYTHDLTSPLSECEALRLDLGQSTSARPHSALPEQELFQFDLVYASLVFEHVPHARQVLTQLYQQVVKPSGVLYLRDTILHQGEPGWTQAHPAIVKFAEIGLRYMASLNDNMDVAMSSASWLEEIGATEIEAIFTKIPIGGTTQLGLQMLRNSVMFVRNVAPTLIKRGLVTQADFDQTMQTLFRELGPASVGHSGLMETIGRKPSSSS
jgi:2-polyprenyl-3-methyl-5-hydroxy-6-metoxy-1,4-benzoquinol methylase